jgi:cell division protease FtsH
MRPGRFDRKVTVPQPGLDARAKILQIHLSKRNVDPEIDTMQFAKNLPGLSGAELANICNEASAISVRRGGEIIEAEDVLNAVDRVTNGLRHGVHDKDNATVHRLTRHELGHALVATILHGHTGLIEAVERVSIVPRGRDPTQTTYNRKRDEEYEFPTRARLLERVQVLLAGRAAEEVFFGDDITTMGSVDVRDANDLVRNVVVNYSLGQPDMLTTYTYDPDTLFTPEKSIKSRKSRVASTGEMGRHGGAVTS